MANLQEKLVSNEEATSTTATSAVKTDDSTKLKVRLSMIEELLISPKIQMSMPDEDEDDDNDDNDDSLLRRSTNGNYDATNDNRAMLNRQSSGRSWANTDWDVIEQKCFRRPSSSLTNSLYSQLSASQSSFYQILDFDIEDLENNESGDGDNRCRGGKLDVTCGLNDDDGDGDGRADKVSNKGETRDKSTFSISSASSHDHQQQQHHQQPNKVKRKSMLELLNEDEDLFSASLASLNLSVARKSTSSTCLFGESDHDFSSYVDDDGDVWRRE